MTTAEATSPRPLACSRLSLEADEDLHGTASTVSGYLVLEHGGPWGTKVLRDAPFSDPDGTAVPLGAHLSTVLGPLGVTTLLVRRPGARHGIPRRTTVMLVAFDGTAAHGARTTVGAVSRLFGWKLPALLATLRSGVVPEGWEPLETQYLVCAHARRDACCGELGRPIVTALAAVDPERVWEVSHVGGHRFAPNTLVLPEGLVYGRVPEDQVPCSLMKAAVPLNPRPWPISWSTTEVRFDCLRGVAPEPKYQSSLSLLMVMMMSDSPGRWSSPARASASAAG